MKRILLAVIVFIIAIFGARDIAGFTVTSQIVRYYKCTAVYDKDGVKRKGNVNRYYTFAHNNTVVYESDAHGTRACYDIFGTHPVPIWKLVGFDKDNFTYKKDNNTYDVLIVSQDFSRLGYVDAILNLYYIYELGNPDDDLRTPFF